MKGANKQCEPFMENWKFRGTRIFSFSRLVFISQREPLIQARPCYPILIQVHVHISEIHHAISITGSNMDIYDLPSSDDDEPMLKDEISGTTSEQQEEEEEINDDESILVDESDIVIQQADETYEHEPADSLTAEPEENLRDQEEGDGRTRAHHIQQTKTRRPHIDDDDSSIGSHSSLSLDREDGSEDDVNRRRRAANSISSLNSGHAGSLSRDQPPLPLIPQTEQYKPGPRSPLKRERQDSLAGGLARNHKNTTHQDRPVKGIKGSFNQHYLDILNEYIRDAGFLTSLSQPTLPTEPRPPSSSSSSSLEYQIDPQAWTTPEKEALFEALSRSGSPPHNTAAIASKIQTKTQFEVAQYLHLLESSLNKRKLLAKRKDLNKINISLADIPTAMEISQPCCDALEEAAHDLARKEETDEEKVERERWGDTTWLINKFTLRDIGKSPKPGLVGALKLFKVGNWLELSERVFMNTSRPAEDNWISITSTLEQEEEDENTRRPEGPGIRVTALEDFYSIVVSLTRRIVATTSYMSEARTIAQRELRTKEEEKELVYKKDIEAALLSLDLPGRTWGNRSQSHGWEEFWVGAARRLRLDVYKGWADFPHSPAEGTEAEGFASTPMPYREVERKLRAGGGRKEIPIEQEEIKASQRDRSDLQQGGYHRDGDRHAEENAGKHEGTGENVPSSPAGSSGISETETEAEEEARNQREREQVENEVDEFVKAARPYVIPSKIRKHMRKRVRAARAQEHYADQMDMKASREEERRLWALLGDQQEIAADDGDGNGDEEIIRVEEEEERVEGRHSLPRSRKGSVEELYEYYCGDEVGFEGELGGGEHGASTGWRFTGVQMEDGELEEDEEEVRGNGNYDKLELGRISAWEVAWMDEKRKRKGEREREREKGTGTDEEM